MQNRTRIAKETPSTKLTIKNLHYEVSDEDIKRLFSEFASFRSSAVYFDRSGRSKGAAQVIYGNKPDALKAMKEYNGVHLDGRPMKISVVDRSSISSLPKGTKKLTNQKVKRLQTKPVKSRGKVVVRCTKEQLDQELNAYQAGRI